MDIKAIKDFQGQYRFLSNFWLCSITYNGLTYKSTEAAYQAAKTVHFDRERFTRYTPAEAKHAGGKNAEKYGFPLIKAPDNWDSEIKIKVMADLVKIKFSQEPGRTLLLATKDATLVEGNVWHDNYWGDCSCQRCINKPGQNMLGKLLMGVREELKQQK